MTEKGIPPSSFMEILVTQKQKQDPLIVKKLKCKIVYIKESLSTVIMAGQTIVMTVLWQEGGVHLLR
jgi:hypothetical protein